MKKVFADAVYWIALLHQKDSLHQQAVAVGRSLDDTQIEALVAQAIWAPVRTGCWEPQD